MIHKFLFSFVFVALLSVSVEAQSWSQLRGNDGAGSFHSKDGILNRTSDVKFKVKWKHKLGSGYSSVVVADQNVVTMFTDGESDFVVCLNAADGEEQWRYKTGPMFKGENGSFDGPLSTPVISDQHVFAISAVGTLYCLTVANGEEVWSKDLKEIGTKQPMYGFVTSPILVEDTLVVQVGAPDKSVVGFDPASGEEKWSVGDDSINSQSPAVVSIDGRTVLLAAGGKKLTGVDPSDGTLLFEFEHAGGNGSAMVPVDIGDGNVLLTLDDAFSKAVSLRQQDDNKIHVSQEWQERSIKNTYNIPVLHHGNVFAYSTRILTCVDATTGRAKWKDRKPGDGFLVIANNHLVIITKKGSLHLAKADEQSYNEIADVDLFKDLVWSVPAVSDDSVYVRSLGEIARVDIEPAKQKLAKVEVEAQLIKGSFRDLIAEASRLGNDDPKRQRLVDEWVASQMQFPYIVDGVAHFIFQGDEEDVALAGDFLGARQETPMTLVEGTNLRYLALPFPDDQRVNYCFLTNFQPVTDRLNPRTVTSSMYAGEMEFAVRLRNSEPLKMSWFAMPSWKEPSYLSGDKQAKLIKHEIALADEGEEKDTDDQEATPVAPNAISIEVILPPGYDPNGKAYPVCYLLGGAGAKKNGKIETALTSLFDSGAALPVKPSITVLATPRAPGFGKLLTSKVIPFVESEYNVDARREARLMAGFGFMGTAGMMIGATNNDVFGNIAVQSPLSFDNEQRMILKSMAEIKKPTKLLMQWGRYDMFNPHENWDVRTISQSLFDGIRKNDQITVEGGMVNDSCDWSSWRNRYDDVYRLLND